MTRQFLRGSGCSKLVLAAHLATVAVPATADYRLDFAEPPRLVDCDPASAIPCFRLRLNVVDDKGAPAGLKLPEAGELASRMTIFVDGQEITPFYVSAGERKLQPRKRVALLLMDVSGSMNARLPNGLTRFEAARRAAETFVKGFEQGADLVAVAPFGSRNVVQQIKSVQFASTLPEVLDQITNIPLPDARSNTALYSAVDTGLDVLMAASRTRPGIEVILLAMTDGRNDIRSGDDAGLLEGARGLDTVARKVKESGVQIVTIGFGDAASLDVAALRRIGTQTFFVQSAEELARAFNIARTLLQDRLQVTFASPQKDRASLAGRTIGIRAALKLDDGRSVGSDEQIWLTPQIGAPAFEGKCDAAELKAALASEELAKGSGWLMILRHALVFIVLGSALLVLWYWVPRLIWPDQYIGDLKSVYSRRRWASRNHKSWKEEGAYKRPLPPGFASGKGVNPPERAPSDATVVQPRTDSGTRTRLDFD